MTTNGTPKWDVLAEQMRMFGCDYSAEQIQDIDFCSEELRKRGYALQMTRLTLDLAIHQREGRTPAYPEAYADGPVTYQLFGPRYPSLGAHRTPLCPSFRIAAITALFEICRMDWDDQQTAATRTNH